MKSLTGRDLVKNYDLLSEEQQQEISLFIANQVRAVVPDESSLDPKKTHKAIGRLFFAYPTKSGKSKPIHNIDVELWDKDIGNPDDFLGACVTDAKGNFEIWYDPSDAGPMDIPDLEIRVYERRYKVNSQGKVRLKKRMITSMFGQNNVTALVYDFGKRKIPYWEYHPEKSTPRVYIAEEGGPPQSYSPGRSVEMIKALASIEAVKRKHIFLANYKSKTINPKTVQKDYPVNKTQNRESEKKGITRTDEYFGDLFLNGMEASVLDRDPTNPDQFWIHHHWNSYEQDGIYAMPNIDIRFCLKDEKLLPVEITVAVRQKGATKPNSPLTKHVVRPEDGKKWGQAKRIARVSAALVAELDSHLCSTHLNTEQYAIAAYRNIRLNPIRHLLFPHIKEVSLINHSADTLLLGETGYVTKATGFTVHSIDTRIRQVMGTLDWRNWQPRKQICENHIYAKAANLYWDAITEYIDMFFLSYTEGIGQHWDEIRMFSKELVENSVPVFLCDFLNGQLASPENAPWYEWNERMDTQVTREQINEETKACSPITKRKVPLGSDLDNLKQVCRYIIYQATFAHWWSNSRQYDEGGELKFTGLGMRFGDNGIFTPESDLSVLPPPKEATMQLWISYMLSYTKFGLITKNEDGDIQPMLIQKILELEEPFKELGLDIHTIPSRTNI